MGMVGMASGDGVRNYHLDHIILTELFGFYLVCVKFDPLFFFVLGDIPPIPTR